MFPGAEDRASARTLAAEALVTLGRKDESVEEFRRAAEECFRAEPRTASFWRQYASHEPDGDKRREALAKSAEILERWLVKNAKNADAWYDLGSAQALLGNDAAAVEHLARAIKLDASLRSEASSDDDFASLRDSAAFSKLLGPVRK